MAAAVTGADVAAFLGRPDDPGLVALAGVHVAIVAELARAYCHGRGFADEPMFATDLPNADLAAVLTTATARLVSQPPQWQRYELRTEDVTVAQLGGFSGWTLAELAVLNAYRRRSA